VNHRQFDNCEVAGRELLGARGDAAALFEPTDQALDRVALAIGSSIESWLFGLHRLIGEVGNDRLDAKADQLFPNPPRVIGFVAGEFVGTDRVPLAGLELVGLENVDRAAGAGGLGRTGRAARGERGEVGRPLFLILG